MSTSRWYNRSFGLILALLSKRPNVVYERSLPISLLIVPHRDLAYQYAHWIGYLTTPTSTPTQVIVRGQEATSLLASRLRENPPSLLIGTPQAILDVLREDEHAINFTGLSTVVVDEVDHIIDFISKDVSKRRKEEHAANMKLHPSAGKLLLDRIYSLRVNGSPGAGSCPQLIACGGTIPAGLRQQLHSGGWFKKGTSVVRVHSEIPPRKSKRDMAAPDVTPDAEVVEHCALIFSKDGSVRDVGGKVVQKGSPESQDYTHGEEVETRMDPQGSDLPKIRAQPTEGKSVYPVLQITELIVGFGPKSMQEHLLPFSLL